MKGTPIARRGGLLESQRLVLHPDRVEQLSLSAFGLDVRRLFFDELSCATVQRQFAPWTELLIGLLCALLGVLLLGLGLWQRSALEIGLGVFALLLFLGLLLLAWFVPPHLLVLRAGDQTLRGSLPRRSAAREEALRRLLRAVERHQRLRDPNRPPGPPGPGSTETEALSAE